MIRLLLLCFDVALLRKGDPTSWIGPPIRYYALPVSRSFLLHIVFVAVLHRLLVLVLDSIFDRVFCIQIQCSSEAVGNRPDALTSSPLQFFAATDSGSTARDKGYAVWFFGNFVVPRNLAMQKRGDREGNPEI